MFEILRIIVAVGVLYYSYKILNDPEYARNYVRTSHKAYLWRKVFGEEKAVALTKNVFAPLGIALGLFLLVSSIYRFL